MPRKSTATAVVEKNFSEGLNPELVRVEESVDDFIKSELPRYSGTQLQICPLWTDRAGRSFFRCKFWKYDTSSFVVTRKEEFTHFVYVKSVNGKRVLVDQTITPQSILKGYLS